MTDDRSAMLISRYMTAEEIATSRAARDDLVRHLRRIRAGEVGAEEVAAECDRLAAAMAAAEELALARAEAQDGADPEVAAWIRHQRELLAYQRGSPPPGAEVAPPHPGDLRALESDRPRYRFDRSPLRPPDGPSSIGALCGPSPGRTQPRAYP